MTNRPRPQGERELAKMSPNRKLIRRSLRAQAAMKRSIMTRRAKSLKEGALERRRDRQILRRGSRMAKMRKISIAIEIWSMSSASTQIDVRLLRL
jgi:hypothetical protein